MNKAGDIIKRAGAYTVVHDRQHIKDQVKQFKPATVRGIDVSFPSCQSGRCGPGYPQYKMKALNLGVPSASNRAAARTRWSKKISNG